MVSGGIWRYLAVFGGYCAITPHYPPLNISFPVIAVELLLAKIFHGLLWPFN